MRTLCILIIFLAFYITAKSQIVDTCEYVDQINNIGGLDCAMTSLSSVTADSYQWLNCDSLFAPISGQTTDYYSGMTSINVALVMTYLGCVDTSECQYVCTWGLEELHNGKVELIEVLDLMGRPIEDQPNTLLIYVYSDGTTERVFRVE